MAVMDGCVHQVPRFLLRRGSDPDNLLVWQTAIDSREELGYSYHRVLHGSQWAARSCTLGGGERAAFSMCLPER